MGPTCDARPCSFSGTRNYGRNPVNKQNPNQTTTITQAIHRGRTSSGGCRTTVRRPRLWLVRERYADFGRGTESLLTLRWREVDANLRYRADKGEVCSAAEVRP